MFSLGWCRRLWDQLTEVADPGDPVVAVRLGRLYAGLQVGRRFALALLAEESAH